MPDAETAPQPGNSPARARGAEPMAEPSGEPPRELRGKDAALARQKPAADLDYELALLGRLVAFNTDSETREGYAACADFIEGEAKNLGLRVTRIEPKARDGLPRPNLIIELNRGGKETLLLVTHYDIVAPGDGWKKRDPFKMARKGNFLYGRGVNDDKGAVAVALGAMRELSAEKTLRRNVKLVVACDEEAGSRYGIKYLVERCRRRLRADVAIIVDSKLNHITHGCSGTIGGKIAFRGKQGHAAYPHKTENVLEKILPFLDEVRREYSTMRETRRSEGDAYHGKYPKVWGRFSITYLYAGCKTNIIPGRVVAGFDIRALPEENVREVMQGFRSYIKEKLKNSGLGQFHPALFLRGSNGYLSGKNAPFIQELRKEMKKLTGISYKTYATLGGDDGRFIARLGIPAVGLGPGGRGAHSPDERITLHELSLTKEMIRRCCA